MKKHLNDIKEILEDTNFQLEQKLNEVGEQYGSDSGEFDEMKFFVERCKDLLIREKDYSEYLFSRFIKK